MAQAGGDPLCLKRISQAQVNSMDNKDLRVLNPIFDSQGTGRIEFAALAEAVARMSQDPHARWMAAA